MFWFGTGIVLTLSNAFSNSILTGPERKILAVNVFPLIGPPVLIFPTFSPRRVLKSFSFKLSRDENSYLKVYPTFTFRQKKLKFFENA